MSVTECRNLPIPFGGNIFCGDGVMINNYSTRIMLLIGFGYILLKIGKLY